MVVTMAIYHDIIKRTATAAVPLVITLLHPAAVSPAFAPLQYGNNDTMSGLSRNCQCLALPPQHWPQEQTQRRNFTTKNDG